MAFSNPLWSEVCERKKRVHTAGFSLLEIIIASSSCIFLCVLTISSLARLQRDFALAGIAQNIAGLVRLARIEALEGKLTTRIIFDILGNRLLFRGKDGVSRIYPMPEGVKLYTTNFPSNELRFSPQGTPLCGGTVTLRTQTKLKYVIVAPVTGRVRLSDTPP